MTRHARPGFNLVEIMVAMSTAAVVLLALGGFIVSSFKNSGSEKDRAFAMQHALQMMEEVASYRQQLASDPDVVSKFNQGTSGYSFTLTTEDQAVPYQPLSGNPRINGNYKYVRQIVATPLTSDPNSIEVTVKVFYAKQQATPAVDTRPGRTKPLAVVSNHLHLAPGSVGPAQALDVYVLAIENMPYIYRRQDGQAYGEDYYMPSATEARLTFEQSLRNFQSANPGLTMRTHYITRLSVGRDSLYKPYINEGAGLASGTRDPLKWVYTYPGKLDSAADGGHYYDPQTISGNVTIGDGSGNVATTVSNNYPLADEFNHAVPIAQEVGRTGDGDAVGSGETAIPPTGIIPSTPPNFPASETMSGLSLRQLLEDMLEDTTGKYRNSIVVNLHGELFPGLPLRPYADAAKDPGDYNVAPRSRRLVTHPYKLNFMSTASPGPETVKLCIYPYLDTGKNTPQNNQSKIEDVRLDSTKFPAYAQSALIRIRNIKNYIDNSVDWTGGGFTIDPGWIPTITMIQREREDGPAFDADFAPNTYDPSADPDNGDKVFYNAVVAWPDYNTFGGMFVFPSTAPAVDEEEGPQTQASGTAPRRMHSGPHLASSHMSTQLTWTIPTPAPYPTAPATPCPYPHWEGNDFVFELKDIDYDAHATQDDQLGSWKDFGIKVDQDHTLHGLQYFPDPFLAFLDKPKQNPDQPRNTARVLVEIPIKSTAAGRRFEVDTQLKKYNRKSDDSLISAANPPAPPATNMGNYLNYLANPALLDDPTVSRTYFYVDATWNDSQALYYGTTSGTYRPTIPYTDQVQLVGDPRHNPYADLRAGDTVNHNATSLNMYFNDMTPSKEMYKTIKNNSGGADDIDDGNDWIPIPTVTATPPGMGMGKPKKNPKTSIDSSFHYSHDSWNGTKFNGPLYFRMWREALLRNGAMLVNVTGQPFGYIGLGGDFSLKGTINDSAALQVSPQLYTNSTSTQAGRNEMDDENPFIFREDGRTDASWPSDWSGLKNDWVGKPWIGELYPSFYYGTRNDFNTNWTVRGNLPAGGTTNGNDLFRREHLGALDPAFWDKFTDMTTANNSKMIGKTTYAGLNSFLNNSASVSRENSTDTTSVTALGTTVAKNFSLTLQPLRSWYPFQIGTGTASTEYGDAWAGNLRDAAPTWLDTSAFVSHAKGGSWTSSRAIMMNDNGSKTPFGSRMAYFFANTFRPETLDKLPQVFDNAVQGMVQTYFDATDTADGAKNVKPVPRVALTAPVLGDVLKLTASPKSITWSQQWVRPDGKPYSSLFTYPTSPPAPGSGGAWDMVYFMKYRSLVGGNGGAWQACKLSGGVSVNMATTTLIPGPYDPGRIPVPPFDNWVTPTPPNVPGYTLPANAATGPAAAISWDYSALPVGDYLFRIEAYRKDPGVPSPNLLGSNYAFHEIRVTISN